MTQQLKASTSCKYHTSEPAKFHCTQCGSKFCISCIKIKEVADTKVALCPDCKALCQRYAPQAIDKSQKSKLTSFTKQLANALAYPIKGQGKYILIAYVLTMIIINFCSILPVISLIGFIIKKIVGAYIIAFLFSVITTSATGEDELPDWPDVSSWIDDILKPALIMIGVTLICFSLPLAYNIYSSYYAAESLPTYPIWIMAAIGTFYFPMALLASALHDNLLAANPITVLTAIFKIFPTYIVLLVMLAIVIGLSIVASSIPYLNLLLNIYFPLVFLRLIGLIYHNNHKKIGWFET